MRPNLPSIPEDQMLFNAYHDSLHACATSCRIPPTPPPKPAPGATTP